MRAAIGGNIVDWENLVIAAVILIGQLKHVNVYVLKLTYVTLYVLKLKYVNLNV